MNISGVTMTAPVIAPSQAPLQAPEQVAEQSMSPEQAAGMDAVSFSVAVSTRVLDMAQSSFEDAAGQLIESMSAALTGLGQNVDMTV